MTELQYILYNTCSTVANCHLLSHSSLPLPHHHSPKLLHEILKNPRVHFQPLSHQLLHCHQQLLHHICSLRLWNIISRGIVPHTSRWSVAQYPVLNNNPPFLCKYFCFSPQIPGSTSHIFPKMSWPAVVHPSAPDTSSSIYPANK